MVYMLLGAFAIAFAASALINLILLGLFPWFRSGERKPGDFKPDESASGEFKIEMRRGRAKPRIVRARSSELPLIGGVGMVLAIVVASVASGFLLKLDANQWMLLDILLFALVGYGLVGLMDDARKVYRGDGISEIQKAIGVILVSGVTAILLNRLVTWHDVTTRLAYPPYTQAPFIGSLLIKQPHAWVIFFGLMTILVASVTPLAVDFSDGMDGLAGGLLLSAGLSYAAILLDEGGTERLPLVIGALVLSGAALGYLPFNWPSSFKGGPRPKGKRWAKLIMGDTGSLALGGLLAIIAIVGRQELLLVVIGGAFVLEGLSALISARILVKFYRRFLYVERFSAREGFPHTELPLPFLATPMHHHYDLLNADRKRLVYGAWAIGAGLGVLGIATAVGPFTWERYLARLGALALLIAVWQAGPWTKAFFIGLEASNPAHPNAPRRLLLCHGAPYRLFNIPLYRRIDGATVTEEVLREPSERLLLWQRLGVFDARALLGYFCYREGDLEDAQRIWDRLPDRNIDVRPEIKALIEEVAHALAIQQSASPVSGAQNVYRGVPPSTSDNPDAVSWRAQSPTHGSALPPRLQPLDGDPFGQEQPGSGTDEALLWQASRWAEASGLRPPVAPAQDPGKTYPPALETPINTTPLLRGEKSPDAIETPSDEENVVTASTSFPGAQRASESGDM